MVGAVTKIVGIHGASTNERCMEMGDAIYSDRHGSIDVPLRAIRRPKEDEERPDYLGANVRVADQDVIVRSEGCGREDNSMETVPVVVGCPVEQSQRCANCILNLEGGKEVVDRMSLTVTRSRVG